MSKIEVELGEGNTCDVDAASVEIVVKVVFAESEDVDVEFVGDSRRTSHGGGDCWPATTVRNNTKPTSTTFGNIEPGSAKFRRNDRDRV